MSKRHKVIIVDDNPSLCELVYENLEEDYEVSIFYSGEDALEKILTIMPDVVLLDIMMPGMDGYEVCSRIRGIEELKNVKILFLSAKSSLKDKLAGYKVKGDDFLVKPFDLEELRAKVAVYVRLTEEEKRRLAVEEELRNSEEKYRSLIENSPDIIIHSDREGKILFSNRNLKGINHKSEISNIFDLVPENALELAKQKVEEVFDTGKVSSFETFVFEKDQKVWYATRIGPMVKDNSINGLTIFSRNISAKKQIEEELWRHKQKLEELVEIKTRDLEKTSNHLEKEIVEKNLTKSELQKSEERYRNILENIEEGYYELDLNGTVTFSNASLARILGLPAEWVLNKDISSLKNNLNTRKLKKTLEYVNSTGNPSPIMKWEIPDQDGASKYLETSISLIREGDQKLGYRGIVRDVSESYAHEKNLEGLFQHAVGTLARAAEVFDQDTGDHTVRIGNYSYQLAKLIGMNEQFQKDIQISAQLHDVGKIHITSAILNKTGQLADEEFEVIKNHTLYGSIIIGRNPDFKMANEIALFHHEKWDGNGYPDGLKAGAIPLAARITAIVDVFDALVSNRSYKKAFSYEKALEIMSKGDNRLNPAESFDPGLLKTFLENYQLFVEIHQQSLQIEMEFQQRRMNVIVLEDDQDLMASIKEHFADNIPFTEIFGFSSIADLNEVLFEQNTVNPHLCFIDVNLPDGTGHDAAVRLKQRFPEAHLICITADDEIDVNKINLYGHRVFRKNPQHISEFMNNLVKTAQIIREYHHNPFKSL